MKAMENKFIIVSLDDWEGMYYINELISEGHEIRRDELVRLMKQHKVWDVEYEYLNQEGENIVQSYGSMFNTYEEVKPYIEQNVREIDISHRMEGATTFKKFKEYLWKKNILKVLLRSTCFYTYLLHCRSQH